MKTQKIDTNRRSQHYQTLKYKDKTFLKDQWSTIEVDELHMEISFDTSDSLYPWGRNWIILNFIYTVG